MKIQLSHHILAFAILALSLSVNSGICNAQQEDNSKTSTKQTIQPSEIAKKQIQDLKEGILFVRLLTRQKSIDAMRKSGQNELADKKQYEQLELNKMIISAFKAEFTFCKVYFFYSDDSKNILDRNFSQIAFVNDSAQKDENIKLVQVDKFFVAEFGSSKQDTAKYYSHTAYEPEGNFSSGAVQVYYGGSNTGAEGLIIMSESFIQLRKPFPYFSKKPSFRKDERAIFMAVEKMNRNLWGFYNMVSNP
jgi:hypothetical protein